MSTVETFDDAAGRRSSLGECFASVFSKRAPVAFVAHTVDGAKVQIGEGTPAFDLVIRNEACLRAFRSLNELKIAEAYIQGDFDIEGDFVAALSFRNALSDRSFWLKAWRRIEPVLFGREKCNPAWIAKHYDMGNIQFFCTDTDYRTYTPGIYDHDEESLETGARHKLEFAFQALGLQAGDTVLDIGCGWGGMLRYAAEHGVRGTGITLSRHQHEFVTRMIEEKKYSADVHYQDFFTFEPNQKYDGITMMGVIEDLSDYHLVMKRLPRYLQPGGRVCLDFATSRKPFDTSSFITRYVWPGTFRLVYLPEFIDAVNRSPFEIVAIYNDRRNYYLWSKQGHDRWMQNKAAILERTSIEQWRMLRLLIGGSAALMSSTTRGAGACRVVLELTSAASPLSSTTRVASRDVV